jgi:hypothetical protein
MSQNLLLDLVVYASDYGTADVDLFRDTMPDSPDNCIAFIEYPGDTSFIAKADLRSIQVRVRNISYEIARSTIYLLYNFLYDPESDDRIIDLPDNRWIQITARQAPYFLQKDESGRFTFIFNMGVLTNRDS